MKLNKDLLIIGIDPGTTLGYAILNVNGDVIKVKSAKGLSLSSLILEIIKKGKILVVGTDVNPVPAFVRDFVNKTGAKLIYPEESLQVREKRKLVRYKVKNKHELDALASALYAFNKIKPLLDKIDIVLKKKNKEEEGYKVKELLIMEKINNIANALR